MRAVLLILAVLFVLGLIISNRDDGAKINFDAREPGRLVEWVTKYHGTAYDNITFTDGILTMQSTDNAGINKIFNAGSHTESLLKAYTKAADNRSALKAIRITYRAELVDKYGNSVGIRPVLTMRFDATEAMKYNFERSTSFDMVEAATIEFIHPAVRDAPKRYCDSSGKYSPTFCRLYWPAYLLKEQ